MFHQILGAISWIDHVSTVDSYLMDNVSVVLWYVSYNAVAIVNESIFVWKHNKFVKLCHRIVKLQKICYLVNKTRDCGKLTTWQSWFLGYRITIGPLMNVLYFIMAYDILSPQLIILLLLSNIPVINMLCYQISGIYCTNACANAIRNITRLLCNNKLRRKFIGEIGQRLNQTTQNRPGNNNNHRMVSKPLEVVSESSNLPLHVQTVKVRSPFTDSDKIPNSPIPTTSITRNDLLAIYDLLKEVNDLTSNLMDIFGLIIIGDFIFCIAGLTSSVYSLVRFSSETTDFLIPVVYNIINMVPTAFIYSEWPRMMAEEVSKSFLIN